MTSLAKEAIKQSFFRIAEKKPIDKITVKDIVEDCGINRNSFYYHFDDLPTLIRQSIDEEIHKIIFDKAASNTLEEVLDLSVDFILAHKQACLNIYQSKHRDLLEYNFLQICRRAVSDFLSRTYFQQNPCTKEQEELIIYYYQSLLYGFLIDWVHSGLRYDIKKRLKDINTIKAVNNFTSLT